VAFLHVGLGNKSSQLPIWVPACFFLAKRELSICRTHEPKSCGIAPANAISANCAYACSGQLCWIATLKENRSPVDGIERTTGKIKKQEDGTAMKFLSIGVVVLCLATIGWASDEDSKNGGELQRAAEVIQNVTSASPDQGVPNQVLEGAKCVAVIPKLVKGAFIVGGEHGTGVATCRTSNGSWSAPAPFSVSGISWGPQIGGKSTDLVMFIMNDQGMNDLLAGHVKVGADVSAAAGPVGRSASADAGYKAGILTYSASKGAFIGASLNGAELQQDGKATRAWYGKDVPFRDILSGTVEIPNADARAFVSAVQSAKESSTR
jgi:lipid-binding SYLF domain-containing protein